MGGSPALRKLAERLSEVELLLSLCSPADVSLKELTAAAPRDSALLRGALVLLCSHLEGYFEDLVSDALAAYQQLAEKVGQVPTDIRARQVIGKPERWSNSDSLRRWEILQECMGHALIQADADLRERAIDAALHIHGFANPGTGEIESLFKTIGISDVWEQFATLEADRLVQATTDAIVNRRNQIAHGNLESTVTRSDVELYITRTRRLAEVMDVVVENEIAERLGKGEIWELVEKARSEIDVTSA
jgi:hypothetical protein